MISFITQQYVSDIDGFDQVQSKFYIDLENAQNLVLTTGQRKGQAMASRSQAFLAKLQARSQ